MKNSLYILEQLSKTLHSHQTYYGFNKHENLTERYKKGRVNASKWLNELIFYYIQKERGFLTEFKEQIQKQKEELALLPDSDFKSGLFDELNFIENIISNENKK